MHVCGLIELDTSTVPGGYSFERLKDSLARRVRPIPMFHRKLKFVPGNVDHPVWVEDTDFDIERHVHRVAVPAPGRREELSELAGHIAGLPLDRSRPLWEMWVIEGLESGKIAVMSKMHHASVDGVSGANMISYLCSLEPDAPPLDPGATAGAEMRVPGDRELLVRAVGNTLVKPVNFVKMVAPTASILTTSVRRAREGRAMAAPLTAPRTSFNGTITGHRSVAFTEMSLDKIKAIRHAVEGATVNDVVLAVSGGALRRYLEERGELPTTSLLATVPVSVRSESKGGGSNKVSSLFTRLRTDLADPVERIQAIAKSNINAKEHHAAIPADTLQDWAQFAAPRVFGLAMRAITGLKLAERGPVIHNLVISNVPGPPVPLYFMGAKIDALYPLGPIFHQAGLNITVMSNNGIMDVGVIACKELMPRVWDLADSFPEELEAMHAAIIG
jgi:diacylglycerol O-acyltransferase / wax synthase